MRAFSARLLERVDFESLVFFSSTRVYALANGRRMKHAEDAARSRLLPSADTTYDLSKLLGEALCLSLRPAVGEGRSALQCLWRRIRATPRFWDRFWRISPLNQTQQRSGKARIPRRTISQSKMSSCLAEKIARSAAGTRSTMSRADSRSATWKSPRSSLDEGYRCSFAPGGDRRVFPRINIEPAPNGIRLQTAVPA